MSVDDKRSDREYKKLLRENKRLKRRVEELEAENSRLRSDMGMLSGDDEISKLWRAQWRRESLMGARNYPIYVISLLKSTSFWSFYKRILSYFRRFRVLSGVFRIATRIAVWAESGVALLASFSVMIVILPVFGILSVASLFVALFRSRNANKHFTEALRGKKVYILFADRKRLGAEGNSDFLKANIRDLASDGSVCLVISPYFFSNRGLGGEGAYVTARQEDEGVYVIRKNYFFMLRRNIIDKVAASVICIY